MNKQVGTIAAVINTIAVLGFGISMLVSFDMGSYICSSIIAISFVAMIGAYCYYAGDEGKVCGIVATAVSAMYAIIILLVYFAQLTTVRLAPLEDTTKQLLDFKQFGLLFNYDLLGYGLMGLATLLIGLTVEVKSKPDRWLKYLLIIHGIFFPICYIMPMLGVFNSNAQQSSTMAGTILLTGWCIYFAPIGILTYRYFKKR